MTSYMVYKPPSALRYMRTSGGRSMTSSLTSQLTSSSMVSSQEGKSPPPPPSLSEDSGGGIGGIGGVSPRPPGPPGTPGSSLTSRAPTAGRASTAGRAPTAVHLTPSGPGADQLDAPGFDHDIPDHILQAWPLVHQVHSRKQPPSRRPPGGAATGSQATTTATTAQTRRKTRNSHGVYRSSVLTPGEVEFMARKREAKRRAALVGDNFRPRHRDARSSADSSVDAGGSERLFVTQPEGSASSDPRDLYSRMTVDSRASLVPSTIEVSLPGPRRQDARRLRLRQERELGLGAEGQSLLLGREKAEGNSIRRVSAWERRRREAARQEQQFILQPTASSSAAAAADWYEAQGLATPSVLHKYLSHTFYSSLAAKPDVDTTSLLQYIRHKHQHGVYVPPPPSSGSEDDDQEEEEAHPQEGTLRSDVTMRTSPRGGPHLTLTPGRVRKTLSCEDVTLSQSVKDPSLPPAAPSLYVVDRPSLERGADRGGGGGLPRRTIRENGCFDLMVGGDRLPEAAGRCLPLQAVSVLNINSQGGYLGNKQQQQQPHLVVAEENTPSGDLSVESEVQVRVEEVVGGEVGEEGGEGEVGDADQGHLAGRADTTKRIRVVLPSSQMSVENLSVKPGD